MVSRQSIVVASLLLASQPALGLFGGNQIRVRLSENHALASNRQVKHTGSSSLRHHDTDSLDRGSDPKNVTDLSASALQPISRDWDKLDADRDYVMYMKIGKSGSSSMLDMIRSMEDTQAACQKLGARIYHSFTADDLYPGQKSFVVMREPVQRFVSIAEHYRIKLGKKPEWKDYFDSPLTVAKAMLTDPFFRGEYTYNKDTHNSLTSSPHLMVGWPASVYVNSNTTILCLEKVRDGLQRMLDEILPGCHAPATIPTENSLEGNTPCAADATYPAKCEWEKPRYDKSEWENNHELIELVKRLYADDLRLYHKHC